MDIVRIKESLRSNCYLLYDKVKNSSLDKEKVLKYSIPAIVLLFGIYSCTSSRKVVTRNIDKVFEISNEIRAHFIGKPDYWGLNTDYILKNNVLSSKFISDNKIVLNNGISLLIGNGKNADTVMPLSQSFDIVINGLNKAQCIAYVEANINKDNLVFLDKITISNSINSSSYEWGGKNLLPVKKYSAKEFCIDKNNTVIWSIK